MFFFLCHMQYPMSRFPAEVLLRECVATRSMWGLSRPQILRSIRRRKSGGPPKKCMETKIFLSWWIRQYDLLVTDPCDFPVYGVLLSHGESPVVTTGFNNKLIWQFKDDLGCPHDLGNSHMSCTVFGSTMYQTRRGMDKEPVQNMFF